MSQYYTRIHLHRIKPALSFLRQTDSAWSKVSSCPHPSDVHSSEPLFWNNYIFPKKCRRSFERGFIMQLWDFSYDDFARSAIIFQFAEKKSQINGKSCNIWVHYILMLYKSVLMHLSESDSWHMAHTAHSRMTFKTMLRGTLRIAGPWRRCERDIITYMHQCMLS